MRGATLRALTGYKTIDGSDWSPQCAAALLAVGPPPQAADATIDSLPLESKSSSAATLSAELRDGREGALCARGRRRYDTR